VADAVKAMGKCKGISVLARRGYTNLTLLENGLAAWEASGYEVERP